MKRQVSAAVAEYILGSSLSSAARKYPLLQRLLWRVDFALVWCLIKLFTLLPVDTASNLGSWFGGIIGPRLRRKTEMFRENFNIAFPALSNSEREALIRRAWCNAGRVLAEYPHFRKIIKSRDRERLHIVLLDPSSEFGEDCPPSIIVAAHHCNWEMAAAAMSKLGIANSSLYTPPTNPFLDRMLGDSRKELNSELLSRDSAARALVRSLNSGRSAGLVCDRRIDDGATVPFFGCDKPSTLLPAKLALKFNINLIPLHIERLRGAEFRVTFHPPVQARNPEMDETAQAVDMMSQVHTMFEAWIKEDPEGWFCPKRLWPQQKKVANTHNADDTEVKSHAA
jgi:KDO2-lipid IV(A) lauroyltransferase